MTGNVVGFCAVPPATSPRLQFSTWLPTAPVIAQPEYAGTSDQFRSPPAGSAAELLTVMSKPMVSPALTGPGGLADFATSICAPTTVTDSFASVHLPVTASFSVSPGYEATHT